MKVIDKRDKKVYQVWGIKIDKDNFPQFLLFDKKAWKWQSAKFYTPVEEEGNVVPDMALTRTDFVSTDANSFNYTNE